MKISLYLPKGTQNSWLSAFLGKELFSSGNIKDKTTRKHIQSGMAKIIAYCKNTNLSEVGVALKFDGETDELIAEPYEGSIKQYSCGNHFLDINCRERYDYIICLSDANEAMIALIGTDLKVEWSDESIVPRKHGVGGMSAVRMASNRELNLNS